MERSRRRIGLEDDWDAVVEKKSANICIGFLSQTKAMHYETLDPIAQCNYIY